MSAAASIAVALVALIPAQAGDRPTASSIQDRVTNAIAEVTGYEEGRLLPVRLRGAAPWTCTRGRGRNLSCSVTRIGPVHRVNAFYKVRGRMSTTRVVVRQVVR